MKFTNVILGTLLVGAVIYTLSVLYLDSKTCSEKGGTLVRGVVWFKCVGGVK